MVCGQCLYEVVILSVAKAVALVWLRSQLPYGLLSGSLLLACLSVSCYPLLSASCPTSLSALSGSLCLVCVSLVSPLLSHLG